MVKLYLSPYAVFFPDCDNTRVELRHALYGSSFKVSADLFWLVSRFLGGGFLEEISCAADEGLVCALSNLITEKILIDEKEFEALQEGEFNFRLNPIEQALQRGFNEGGPAPNSPGIPPPTVEKKISASESVQLTEHSRLTGTMSFQECLEKRQSVRSYGAGPLRLDELEQFLQLTAKAYGRLDIPAVGQLSLRNYPSGGAKYPLEIYPVVNNVVSIKPGIYHYQPFTHRLGLIGEAKENRRILVNLTKEKMGSTGGPDPAVLFILTAVFARTCYKYRHIPLQLILSEVGGLCQTMYLAATFLGLAPCAIGAFPELATTEILGLDARDESQVGLFALGVPPETAPEPLLVTEVRSSEDGQSGMLDLRFSNGMMQQIAISLLNLGKTDEGLFRCDVMRGRRRAVFDAAATRQLESLMESGSDKAT